MMNYQFGRELQIDADIPKIQIFLKEMRHSVSQAGYFHLGDILFRINFPPNRFDISKDIRIWEDNGKVCGFVLFIPTLGNPEFQIRPDLYKSRIAEEMILWATTRAKQLGIKRIETSCLDTDELKQDFLARNGFRFYDEPYACMEKNLETLPPYSLPDGYSFISANDRPDLPGITGTPMTADEYGQMIHPAEYKDDLGLRVCFDNREIAAGCICWFDEIDKCGLFEPVGTNENHRQKGLAFAVIAKTLENLKRNGADTAYVHTSASNVPAIRLYEKLGFSTTNIDNGFYLDIK